MLFVGNVKLYIAGKYKHWFIGTGGGGGLGGWVGYPLVYTACTQNFTTVQVPSHKFCLLTLFSCFCILIGICTAILIASQPGSARVFFLLTDIK